MSRYCQIAVARQHDIDQGESEEQAFINYSSSTSLSFIARSYSLITEQGEAGRPTPTLLSSLPSFHGGARHKVARRRFLASYARSPARSPCAPGC
jgi:hypothetical protein